VIRDRAAVVVEHQNLLTLETSMGKANDLRGGLKRLGLPRSRSRFLAAAVLVVALAAAGCSSSTKSSSTSSSVPSTANGGATTASNKALQQGLAEVGCYSGPIDGIIGPSTVEAIRAFQTAVGLSPDGVYGANTQQHLLAAEKKGSKVCTTSTSTTTTGGSTTTTGASTTTSGATTTSVPETSTTNPGTTTTSMP
jgi:peptidoglycan hydrolase-like protein with peptidoglycan-binding domain